MRPKVRKPGLNRLNCVRPPPENAYVEALTHGTVLGDKKFKEIIKVK